MIWMGNSGFESEGQSRFTKQAHGGGSEPDAKLVQEKQALNLMQS